jgi:AAHS family 4-hydroxybenzoate transporter-like MFS transporter
MSDSLTIVDVGALLERAEWRAYQKALTILAAAAVIFDGFDIQILGFAIPSIMREWHVARGDFARVLAIGLAGMAIGSPLAGHFGDRLGRRTALIGCVILFGGATIATAFAQGIAGLVVFRFLTGMGAGGALPNAGALSSEFAPLRWRPVAVTFTLVCVPLGGMLGGVIAARVLPTLGWRAMYLIGGAAPMALALILLVALPESPRFMARRPRQWPRLVKLLRRMGHAAVPFEAHFEDKKESAGGRRVSLKSLFAAECRLDTFGLWIAFFACMNGIYLVFGWLPAMLTAQRLDIATASSGLASYNFGGVLGVVMWAALISMTGSRKALIWGALLGTVSALALFLVPIQPSGGHTLLIVGLGLNGLLANAVQTTMYALAAHVYPTEVRASGIASAAAVGRIGAMMSSFTGAALIQAGAGAYIGVLAISMAITAAGLAIVRNHIHGFGLRR